MKNFSSLSKIKTLVEKKSRSGKKSHFYFKFLLRKKMLDPETGTRVCRGTLKKIMTTLSTALTSESYRSQKIRRRLRRFVVGSRPK